MPIFASQEDSIINHLKSRQLSMSSNPSPNWDTELEKFDELHEMFRPVLHSKEELSELRATISIDEREVLELSQYIKAEIEDVGRHLEKLERPRCQDGR